MDRERAKNPNTPLEELRALARYFPEDVSGNPVLSLFSIEDPAGWLALRQEIEDTIQEHKLREGLAKAEQRTLSLFVADCIEQTLAPIEESQKALQESPYAHDDYYYKPMIQHARRLISLLRQSPEKAHSLGNPPTWVDGAGDPVWLPEDLDSLSGFLHQLSGPLSESKIFGAACSVVPVVKACKGSLSEHWPLRRLEHYLGRPISLPADIPWYRLPREEQARHPKTPIDVLKTLLEKNAAALVENPALSSPDAPEEARALWCTAKQHTLRLKIEARLQQMPHDERQRLLLECAERVEGLVQSQEERKKISEALSLIRLSLEQPTAAQNLEKLSMDFNRLANRRGINGVQSVYHALMTFCYACDVARHPTSASYGVHAMISALWISQAKQPQTSHQASPENQLRFIALQEETLRRIEP